MIPRMTSGEVVKWIQSQETTSYQVFDIAENMSHRSEGEKSSRCGSDEERK